MSNTDLKINPSLYVIVSNWLHCLQVQKNAMILETYPTDFELEL